jgi:hypothetical protein
MRPSSCLAYACVPLLAALAVACGDDTTTGGGGSGGGSGGSGGGGGSEAPPPPEDCGDVTVITQVGATSTLYSTGGVGFEFEPAMGLAEPEVITVSPQYQGIIQTGTRDLTGDTGVVQVYASVDAVTDLINAPFGTVDGRLFIAIGGRVTIDAAPETGTQFKGRVSGTLSDAYFIELDDSLAPVVGGDCLYLADGAFDAASYEASCEAPAVAPSGGACLPFEEIGHDCNPITNEGCALDEICDWGGNFRCYPVEGTEVGLCEPCHGLDGPKCGQGLTCDSDMSQGVCHKYCCDDGDCGAGGECIAYSFAPWNMGVCLTP